MRKKWNRIGASAIDNAIIIVLITVVQPIMIFLFGYFLTLRGGGNPIELIYDFMRIIFWLLFSISIAVLYNFLTYKRFEKTLGQMLLRVRIVDIKTTDKKYIPITSKQLLKRETYKWTFLIGTMYLYGLYSIVGIIVNKKLYHNKIANTKVEVWI